MDALASIRPAATSWLLRSNIAELVQPFRERLVERRYASKVVRSYTYCLAHFAHWAQRRPGGAIASVERFELFLDRHLAKCCCPPEVSRDRGHHHAALAHLRALLHEQDIPITEGRNDIVDEELRHYDDYMRLARGLAPTTRALRLRTLRPFIEQRVSADRTDLLPLTADHLRQFFSEMLQRWSVASAGTLAGALRSYLRYRATHGDAVNHLISAIARPPNWRLAPLPQTLTAAETTRLLGAFGPGVASARRGYAMVRCLVDLGLRSSEVVDLSLDDIDWKSGTVRLCRNKSRRVDILPLPHSTGSAIASYLQHERPSCAGRHLFVRCRAPVEQPVGAATVRRVVLEAFQRCGLPPVRAHALRNTLAERLLDHGGTLKDVADILRHRELNTTMIYAKVNNSCLAEVAMPWPGSAS
ncbi:tyrosine-type recombinase/integrase [Paraburkholderia sp. BCC1885]|uniref:tyrosine-type recombinase/integrase n=1 Tax=Paraburkholderia sp. BCC1885 TaxID=2562669 RepID=UPI001183DE16|nr:tyrosine-type recombinase/integrase [Paraburkholderia sp. BCC1885]